MGDRDVRGHRDVHAGTPGRRLRLRALHHLVRVSLNHKNSVEHSTGTFHLTGSDGSTINAHITEHISTNAKGELTVAFEKVHMTCG